MSLRTDYTGALDTKLAQARQAGYDFVKVTNLAQLGVDMAAEAAKGVKTYTLNYGLSFQPEDLRLEGPLWEAFKSGVLEGFASEDIMGNEIAVVLNTSDTVSTSIDLNFTL